METAVKVVLVPGGLLPATLHQWCCGPGAQRSVQPQYRWRVLRQEMIFLSPPSVNVSEISTGTNQSKSRLVKYLLVLTTRSSVEVET